MPSSLIDCLGIILVFLFLNYTSLLYQYLTPVESKQQLTMACVDACEELVILAGNLGYMPKNLTPFY